MMSLILSIIIFIVLIGLSTFIFLKKIKEIRVKYSSRELIANSIMHESIVFTVEIMITMAATVFIACLLCCPTVELKSVITEKTTIQAVIEDVESGGAMSTLEKCDFARRIAACNDDIEYLITHCDSKWNGLFVADEAKELTKIEIPEFLKDFA